MKLGLGTVQFGQPYGIAGRGHRVADDEVERILAEAAAAGFDLLDTAPAYGDSEEVLGRLLPPAHTFRIVTKTPVFRRPLGAADRAAVVRAFEESLGRLRRSAVYGLLVHDADDLLGVGGEHIFEALAELREAGTVTRIGASVYEAGQIDRILERFPVDLIQAPLNVLDQRLLRGGHLAKMMRHGVEVHARSVLLQGLLVMEPSTIPPQLDPIRGHLSGWADRVRERGLSPLAAALAFVRGSGVDAALCGVETTAQLAEIREALEAEAGDFDWQPFGLDDPRYLDPRNWGETR